MVNILEREMADAEFARKCAGFEEHALEHGHGVGTHEQYGFVALSFDTFIGCASGRAYLDSGALTGWFYLSDMFVEKEFRKRNLAASLLAGLENRARGLGVLEIWTDTAGYEAPGFYKKQGYSVFCERENRYFTGHSEILLRKKLAMSNATEYEGKGPFGNAIIPNIPNLRIEERLMTTAEYARMNEGFDEHTVENGNPIVSSKRYGFVGLDDDRFVGAISGLAGLNWFFITDLFLERSYRNQGLGSKMLRAMEMRAIELKSKTIWAWTTNYEATWFSEKQGYKICCVQENWTRAGHSRVGLRKDLIQ